MMTLLISLAGHICFNMWTKKMTWKRQGKPTTLFFPTTHTATAIGENTLITRNARATRRSAKSLATLGLRQPRSSPNVVPSLVVLVVVYTMINYCLM
ncbi:unnamed protein product [Callosobruchus maculatus]|uniref:Uncharacterized protein n=1 Tax=Callosobruchus maculatus TaxID=64391 RepID=A0A653CK99_CALMS|nr:unnamed protein product [Callosobruchus maculatus]